MLEKYSTNTLHFSGQFCLNKLSRDIRFLVIVSCVKKDFIDFVNVLYANVLSPSTLCESTEVNLNDICVDVFIDYRMT